jgi:hypothetical protein
MPTKRRRGVNPKNNNNNKEFTPEQSHAIGRNRTPTAQQTFVHVRDGMKDG